MMEIIKSSNNNSSSGDYEMIHTTVSKKEVTNIILFKFYSFSNVKNIIYS